MPIRRAFFETLRFYLAVLSSKRWHAAARAQRFVPISSWMLVLLLLYFSSTTLEKVMGILTLIFSQM